MEGNCCSKNREIIKLLLNIYFKNIGHKRRLIKYFFWGGTGKTINNNNKHYKLNESKTF